MTFVLLTALSWLLSLAAWGQASAATAAETPVDPAERIVSLHFYATEALLELGLSEQVVGRDVMSASYYDPEATFDFGELPSIGHWASIGAESVLALRPTLVVGTERSGPDTAIRQLQGATEVLLLDPRDDLEGALARVAQLAEHFGLEARAEALEAEMTAVQAELAERVAGVAPKPALALASHGGVERVCGRGPHETLLELAGLINLLPEVTACEELNAEALITLEPAVLVFSNPETFSFFGGHEGLTRHPALGRTPAVQGGRYVVLGSAEQVLGVGLRTPHFATALFSAAYEHDGAVRIERDLCVSPLGAP
jgi:iron complex transport system substrate-binding protein